MSEAVVYFVQAEHGGPIKIGYCAKGSSVAERLGGLQTGNPQKLVVRRVIPAPDGVDTEREWHRRFAKFRLEGEWFADAPEVAMATGALLPAKRDGLETRRLVQNAYKAGREDISLETEQKMRADLREFFEMATEWFLERDLEPEESVLQQPLRVLRRFHGVAHVSTHGRNSEAA